MGLYFLTALHYLLMISLSRRNTVSRLLSDKFHPLEKRKLDIVVISDVHLGTYGCKAKELCRYLCTIDPGILILNGDIVDIWQFSKKYWPKSHMQVIKQITSMLSRGVKVYYITGNHDEMLRRFENFSLGDFHIENKLVLHHQN